LTDLEYVTREPAGDPEGLLVLFHGRGAGEWDLYPLFDALDPARRLLGVAPRGPLALPPGGAHWYAVHRIGYPDPDTFLPTYARAAAWLDGLGHATERTVLGGFSQGAVMSYALAFGRGRPRPAAVIALSGFVPTVQGFELDLSPPLPPVAIAHGTLDPLIDVAFGRRAKELLANAGADVLYHEAPLPHTVDPAFLDRLAPWLEAALGSSDD
jgi:phospholipase/carboxylesterase